MKGLLYKEYAVLKSQMKSWLVLLAFFVVYTGIFRNDYIAAMPVSRFQMVLAKYLFIILLDIALAAVSLILAGAWGWAGAGAFPELSASVAAIMGVLFLMQIISIPLIYAIGVNRARYAAACQKGVSDPPYARGAAFAYRASCYIICCVCFCVQEKGYKIVVTAQPSGWAAANSAAAIAPYIDISPWDRYNK